MLKPAGGNRDLMQSEIDPATFGCVNLKPDFLTDITPDLIFDGERYFTRQRLAQALGLSVQTLAGYLTHRQGPAFIKIGKACLYGEKAVRTWMKSRVVNPTQR